MARTPTTQIPLGFKAPEFTLPDVVSGKNITLSDVTLKNGVVVMFICNHCPFVVHVIDQVILVPNVVATAVANPNFSILVAALTDERLAKADFANTLSGDGPFTIFAPTNEAFTALLASNEEWNGLADIPAETLEAVLKYHVIVGDNINASEITDGAKPTTFEGNTFVINTTDGVVITDVAGKESNVILADVQASNGVIHAIDRVLIPLK